MNFNIEYGLVNFQNYGVFANIANDQPVYINTDDINVYNWSDYTHSIYNILSDGIETKLVQNYKINVSFGNKITVRLTPVDMWFNLIMWRLIIFTDQKIQPKHIVFTQYITKKSIKKFIDNFCIKVKKREIPNNVLNGIISDCLTEISKVDNFAFFMSNTFNLEDFASLMEISDEFRELMHPDLTNVPLEDVKRIGDENTRKMIDIMVNTNIYNPYGKPYKHCLATSLAIGEGTNPKQFREFSVNIGTKPNNEGGIFPHAINNSFITGGISDPYDYYMDASSARIAQILQKENVGTSGYFARLLGLNNTDTKLHSDINFDCHTNNYIELHITSDRILAMLDDRWYRNSVNGMEHLIDAERDKHLIGKTVLLRSPITCASASAGNGICRKCYGELYHTNMDINPGRYASEKLSSELTQRLLSAKHLLETFIKAIKWCKEFEEFFDISSNCITLDQEVNTKGFSLIIDPEDIDYEDDVENSDEEDTYSEYVSQIFIKTPTGEEIRIYSETDDKLYISNTLNNLIRKKASNDNGRFILPFSVIYDEPLFFIVLHNNDLMRALQDVKDSIDKVSVTTAKGITKDILINNFINTIIVSNLSIQAVHLEVIIMNQIRAIDDVLEKPDWLIPNVEYQILTMRQALDKNPSIIVSLMNEKLEKTLYNPLSFRKKAPSFIDLFFMENPQQFITDKRLVDDTVEYKDFGANDTVNNDIVSPISKIESVESED